MADLSINLARHQIAQPVLGRLRSAFQHRLPGASRLRGRLGRRRLEDHRRPHRQHLLALLGAERGHASAWSGFNNIELISDRSPETNFREITEVKQRWPDRAVIASLMVDTRERWHEFVKRSEDAGADGIELNFGCPHGMCERGMGSAVGQQPPVTEKIVGWVMEVATIPVIVKLTPNITDVTYAARAAKQGRRQRHLAHQHDQQHHAGQPRQPGAGAVRRRVEHARRLLRAGGEADRAEHGAELRGRPRGRACPSPASAASPTGATRRSSSPSARPASRCAPPSCTTASASWRT